MSYTTDATNLQIASFISEGKSFVDDGIEVTEEIVDTLSRKNMCTILPELQTSGDEIIGYVMPQETQASVDIIRTRAANQAFVDMIPKIWKHDNNEDILQAIQRVTANTLEYLTQTMYAVFNQRT